MPQIPHESILVCPDRLRTFCAGALRAAGLLPEDADTVADSLVSANLRGIDSHGVARLPHYMRRLKTGTIRTRPNITTERLGPAVARVDGDHGPGQLVMVRAADEAMALARDAGAGWAAVKNSSHCGALAYYGLRIAKADMIGLVFTHATPLVIPFAAAEPFSGTNPICVTVPGRDGQTLCLDMATSKVTGNSIKNAAMEGVEIPPGWGVDAHGRDTTDPGQIKALYPIGTYKGSGLGIVVDVLCALLGGAPFGPHVSQMYDDLDKPRLLGGMVGAIDIGRFVDPDAFRGRLSTMLGELQALRRIDPDMPVLYPGQPEVNRQKQRQSEGTPLGLNLLQELKDLARDYGVAWPFET